MVKIEQGKQVYFKGELLPMKVIAANDKFAVCTREINKDEDDDTLSFEVMRGAYLNKESAWNYLKDEVIYSCLDLQNMEKGTHNLIFNLYDFKKVDDMLKLLKGLTSGDVELSRRNKVKFEFDLELMQ